MFTSCPEAVHSFEHGPGLILLVIRQDDVFTGDGLEIRRVGNEVHRNPSARRISGNSCMDQSPIRLDT